MPAFALFSTLIGIEPRLLSKLVPPVGIAPTSQTLQDYANLSQLKGHILVLPHGYDPCRCRQSAHSRSLIRRTRSPELGSKIGILVRN